MNDEEFEGLNEIEKDQYVKQHNEELLNKAFYSCFHSPEGQIVLNDLLARFYRLTSLNENADANMTLAAEGKRFVAIYILARMESVSGRSEDLQTQ